MWGALIGAGVSAIGSIIGSRASASAAQRQQKYYNEERQDVIRQEQENRNWYMRRVNEDYTQTAEAVNTMRQAREAARDQINAERGAQAVQGGIGEVGKDQANKMLDNTYANIAARGTAQKNAVESQYLQQKNNLANQRMSINDKLAGVEAQRAQNIANAASGVAKIGAGIVQSAVSNAFNSPKMGNAQSNPFVADIKTDEEIHEMFKPKMFG